MENQILNIGLICPVCDQVDVTLKDHRLHVWHTHCQVWERHSTKRQQLYCKHCDHNRPMFYDTYSRHLRNKHADQIFPVAIAENENESLDNDFGMDYEMVQINQEAIEEQPTPNAFIDGIIENVVSLCNNFWMDLLAQPAITRKTVTIICNHQYSLISSVLEVLKFNNDLYENAKSTLEGLWKENKSEYKRTKKSVKLGHLILPTKFAITSRHQSVSTFTSEDIVPRTNYMAKVDIRTTIKTIITKPSIFNSLRWPSEFIESQKIDHCFAGQRGRELYELLGRREYLGLHVYWDDFGTTNPLRPGTASRYSMTGIYFRILNLPIELQGSYEHIFLAVLAQAKDFGEHLQTSMRHSILIQLKDLEEEGITLSVNGITRHYPVVLFNVISNNKGLHEGLGFKVCFSSGRCCRHCLCTYEQITNDTFLHPELMRTKQGYDDLFNRNNEAEISAAHLTEKCALNELQYFHAQEQSTADLMHDWFQGHVRYMAAMVLLSFPDYRRVKALIKDFPFQGRDRFNLPRETTEGALGRNPPELKSMTSSQLSTFIRLLPLILAPLEPTEDNAAWKILLKFQEIYDILMALSIDESTIIRLEVLIPEYLALYVANGGHMTIKAHYLLHYPDLIRKYGPLRLFWAMRFEGKHQMIKGYANVNRCVKSLPMTLAQKHQYFASLVNEKMDNPNFIQTSLKSHYEEYYKVEYDCVVITKENDIPVFGRIIRRREEDGKCIIAKLTTTGFNIIRHAYEVTSTTETILMHPRDFVIFGSMRLYHSKYIRLPFALP